MRMPSVKFIATVSVISLVALYVYREIVRKALPALPNL